MQRIGTELGANRRGNACLRRAGGESECVAERRRPRRRHQAEPLQLLADLPEIRAGVEVVPDEQITERQQDGAGDQEDNPVKNRQAQPDRGGRPAHQASLYPTPMTVSTTGGSPSFRRSVMIVIRTTFVNGSI